MASDIPDGLQVVISTLAESVPPGERLVTIDYYALSGEDGLPSTVRLAAVEDYAVESGYTLYLSITPSLPESNVADIVEDVCQDTASNPPYEYLISAFDAPDDAVPLVTASLIDPEPDLPSRFIR